MRTTRGPRTANTPPVFGATRRRSALEAGSGTLTNLRLLSPHLTAENIDALINEAAEAPGAGRDAAATSGERHHAMASI